MSGNLAIAAVSAVMKYLLLNPISGDSISSVIPNMRISILPLHKVDDGNPCLNIFFYRATSNPGWQQHDLPSRNTNGERVSNPYLALDLYYLITAHAKKDYQGEVMLGFAMQTFHENPVLPRATIRNALTSASLVTPDTSSSVLAAFAATDLAEQIEQIKITPHYPAVDEMSNLWGSINSGYVPTAYYKTSVVLIESKRPARSALPVRGYNVYAMPFKHPNIESVTATGGIGLPILAEGGIALRGSALRAEQTHVIVADVDLSGAALTVANEQITFNLPAGLPAGIIGVRVAHLLNIGTPPALHRGVESNVAAFILQPQITKTGSNYNIQVLPPSGGGARRLRITLNPLVKADQHAEVLLNEFNAPATRDARAFLYPAKERDPGSAPTDQLTFHLTGVLPGVYFVRVRIDGAESPLDYQDGTGFVSPLVTLP